MDKSSTGDTPLLTPVSEIRRSRKRWLPIGWLSEYFTPLIKHSTVSSIERHCCTFKALLSHCAELASPLPMPSIAAQQLAGSLKTCLDETAQCATLIAR